eukprot:137574_1
MTHSNWTQLKSFEFKGHIGVPLMINNHEFVVVGEYYNGIHSFNINHNEWSKLINIDSTTSALDAHSCSLNKQKQLLFICDFRKVLVFDLNKKQLKNTSESSLMYYFPTSTYVNNKLHFIVGNPVKHIIWDPQTKLFKTAHEFDEFKYGIEYHSLIHLKSKKSVLLFGGEDHDGDNRTDSIYEYCLLTQKWNKLNIKMPAKLSRFGIVCTRFDEYIIILGGSYDYNASITMDNKYS